MTRANAAFFWSRWSFERRAAALIALALALRALLAAGREQKLEADRKDYRA